MSCKTPTEKKWKRGMKEKRITALKVVIGSFKERRL